MVLRRDLLKGAAAAAASAPASLSGALNFASTPAAALQTAGEHISGLPLLKQVIAMDTMGSFDTPAQMFNFLKSKVDHKADTSFQALGQQKEMIDNMVKIILDASHCCRGLKFHADKLQNDQDYNTNNALSESFLTLKRLEFLMENPALVTAAKNYIKESKDEIEGFNAYLKSGKSCLEINSDTNFESPLNVKEEFFFESKYNLETLYETLDSHIDTYCALLDQSLAHDNNFKVSYVHDLERGYISKGHNISYDLRHIPTRKARELKCINNLFAYGYPDCFNRNSLDALQITGFNKGHTGFNAIKLEYKPQFSKNVHSHFRQSCYAEHLVPLQKDFFTNQNRRVHMRSLTQFLAQHPVDWADGELKNERVPGLRQRAPWAFADTRTPEMVEKAEMLGALDDAALAKGASA